jgi:hypothetical protein
VPRDQYRDTLLIEAIVTSPRIAREAAGIISWRTGNSDPLLIARRTLEYKVRADPMRGITAGTYRDAAAALRDLGRGTEAAALEALAATGAELEQASRQWRARYEGRPLTAAERDGQELLEAGIIVPRTETAPAGVDGARYAAANCLLPHGASRPVVIVAAHAQAAEIVTGFRDENEQAAWLADRRQVKGRPAGSTLLSRHLPPGERQRGLAETVAVTPVTGWPSTRHVTALRTRDRSWRAERRIRAAGHQESSQCDGAQIIHSGTLVISHD